jgi:uncharacterized protein YkwD
LPAKHRRRSLRTLALAAATIGGVVAAASATSANAASAHGRAGWHQSGPERAQNIGTLSGVRTLAGPARVAPGGWVLFTLSGPGRMVRADATAPFELTVDTRSLPDGAYTFTVLLLVPHRMPVVTTRVLRILNHPAAPAGAPAPATTVPRPSTTVPRPPARSTTPASNPPTVASPGLADFVAQVVRLTNGERARNGCGALRVNAVLTTVAQAHSADMARNDYFSHDSRNGASPFDRMTAAGYHYSTAGENIAAGQLTPSAVMTGWMNSPGHRANILNCAFTEIGVGYAASASSTYPTYWTQDFGTPR